jgi:Ca2+/H+ antiporter, TMEM165/GDT1 family
MTQSWTHLAPTVLAAFFASMVEFVEALTVILAVGTVRGWRGALMGAGAAIAVLLALVAVLGPALRAIPLTWIQIGVGALLLLFGLRWLRKAALRAAGIIPLHDEAATFDKETERLRGHGAAGGGFDAIGFAAAFQITMLEGAEVVFIVIAVGAGGPGLLAPACLGALGALMVVILLGVLVNRPLSQIPENTLKFVVGVLLSAFGCFWFGEGVGVTWPGDDWAILALIAGFALTALIVARLSGRKDAGALA